MARCDQCGSIVLFGGERLGRNFYCGARCRDQDYLAEIADQLPPELVDEHVRAIHEGECPVCGGEGPVDMHTSHWVWSMVIFTRYGTTRRMSCRRCAVKARLGAMVGSGVAGWWGIPFGLVLTPIQVVRNAAGLFRSSFDDEPSKDLVETVRRSLAGHLYHLDDTQEPEASDSGFA